MLGVTEAGGQVEATDPAGHADQPGHHADFLAETLRHQLEDRAVTHPQSKHGANECDQRHPGLRQIEADHAEEEGREDIHHGQRLDAADTVSHVAANRAHQRTGKDAAGGEETGHLWIKPVLGVEVDDQRGSQTDEAAKGDRVEEHEPPGILVLEHFQVFGKSLRRRRIRRILGHEDEGDQHDGQRNQHDTENIDPAKSGGQTWRKERSQRRAGVTGASNTHRRALMFGRIPARSQWQGGGKRRAGHTEEQAENQHFGVGMHAHLPGVGHRGNDDHLTDDRRFFRRQAINQNAHDDTQQRASQHRRRHHHAFFGM